MPPKKKPQQKKPNKKPSQHSKQEQSQESQQQQQPKSTDLDKSKQTKTKPDKTQDATSQLFELIDKNFSTFTEKHKNMKTFSGIITKHNLLQLRKLIDVSLSPSFSKQIDDKTLKQSANMGDRDINFFIFHADVVIGVILSKLQNNKSLKITCLCILPYFRNYGFGSRVVVELIKNVIKRKNINKIYVDIDPKDEKLQKFFNRLLFTTESDNNNDTTNNDNVKNKKKENENSEQDNTSTIKMSLDVNAKQLTSRLKPVK